MDAPPQTASGIEVARLYSILAPVYDIWAELTESRARERLVQLAELARGESVLEVAVGTGKLLARVMQTGDLRNVVGLDFSHAMILRARRRLDSARGARAHLCLADGRKLPISSRTFDVVLNCYMLDLLAESDIPHVLEEFRRVLRPDGRLLLAVMGEQGRMVNVAWMWIYRHAPALVGGCRPVSLPHHLERARWQVEARERVSQNGFWSELIVARPGARI